MLKLFNMDNQGVDECGIYSNEPGQTSSDNILLQPTSLKTHPDCDVYQSDSNIIPHFPPKYREFSTEEQRLKTFKDRLWPIGLNQKPELLAKAGFYYRGISDQVLCFYCEGGLQNWEPNDDPWEEHARHFPRCGFLNVIKSPGYVRKIQEEFKRTTSNHIPMYSRSTSSVSSSSTHSTRSTESQSTSPEDYIPNKPIDPLTKHDEDIITKHDEDILRRENLRLKDERLCKICADKELGVVFIPCGHFVTCTSCAASLPKCPVCRSTITNLVKTYLS
jgi:hypothetical protein